MRSQQATWFTGRIDVHQYRRGRCVDDERMFKRMLVPVDPSRASSAEGRRGLRRAVLGSDAEEVLRRAAVPVLLTRR